MPGLSTMAAFSVVTSSLLFVILYFFHSFVNLGVKKAALYFGVAAVLSYILEFIGINTGIFGTYVYTANLAPFIGEIPLFIPLLWASLSYFCMMSSDNYIVAAGLMVLLDLSFDPRFSLQLWRWVPAGPYFGVPIQNFVGWFATSLIIFGAYYLLTKRRPSSSLIAIVFYWLLGLGEVLEDANVGLYEVAAISTVLFSVAVLLIYVNARRRGASRAMEAGLLTASQVR